MDTLLNLSDEEIETINPDHELVSFDRVRDHHTPRTDINVSYLLGSSVTTSSFDWVGLFKHGWTTTYNYLTYEWAPQRDVSPLARGRRHVMVPWSSSWDIYNVNDKFQLLYVTSRGDVIGVSKSFIFGAPDLPEICWDAIESQSESVVESFSDDFLDIPSLETLVLSSDSGHSSEAEQEDEDVDLPIKLDWDNSSLTGDFSGKSWFEELELLQSENVVKEYDPTTNDLALVPYIPSFFTTCSSTSSKPKRLNDLFCQDVDEDEVMRIPQVKEKKTHKEDPLSLALVPVFSASPSSHGKSFSRYGNGMKRENQSCQLPKRKPIELPFRNCWFPNTSKDNKEVDIEGCLPELFQEKSTESSEDFDSCLPRLFQQSDVSNHTNNDMQVATLDTKKREKEDQIRLGMEIIKQLIAAIPETYLPRPLTCAPDCIACVVCRLMLGHYQHRLVQADERAKAFEEKNVALQKSLDKKPVVKPKKVVSKPSRKQTTFSKSNMANMVKFVKTAEETIALLDDALSLALVEKHRSEPSKALASEKSQQTQAIAIKDAATDYAPVQESLLFKEQTEKDGWKIKHPKKIYLMQKSIDRKTEALQQAHETIQCQQGQITLYEDVLKELRRNIREERRQVRSARQEVMKLRRQVKSKPSSPAPWSKAFGKVVEKADVGVSTMAQPVKRPEAQRHAPSRQHQRLQSTANTARLSPEVWPLPSAIVSSDDSSRADVSPSSSSKPVAVVRPFQTAPLDLSSTAPSKHVSWASIARAENSLASKPELPTPIKPEVKASANRPNSLSPNGKIESLFSLARAAASPSPFCSDKKAFRQQMNLQIREGRCRMCGMVFSSKADKRLIEEHIVYHHQFNL